MRPTKRALRPFFLIGMMTIIILAPILYYHAYESTHNIIKPTPLVLPAQDIPDRAHFVYVVEKEEADLVFSFSQALSVFAARYHWHPREIFLHTNVAERSIVRARQGLAGKWSRMILNVPEMTVVKVQLPMKAANGVPIRHMEHKSDFVRVQAVRDFGGVYLDFDAHVLRDIRPLLRMGFRAVGGRQVDGLVISGTFMASKGAKLVSRWYDEMHRVYDGAWITHSNKLITSIGQGLVSEAGQMLILDRAALAPGDWSKAQCTNLWQTHDSTSASDAAWLHDYSDTWVLHAFSPHRFQWRIKGYSSITPRYVFANASNFARAVMPVARHMAEQGLVGVHDEN
ncbi:hypothetical protein CP532_2198 [Ophiocordyceps camponoti-leonardi (nom. inval.)]|nr:hypothetical protein CP532_2198 [Ophiocordyceps camponoti-leonardi (nom. inval.)]